MLAHGVGANVALIGYPSLLNLVCEHRSTEVVRELLAHGAIVNSQERGRATPLHEAARSGNMDIVLELLAHGAEMNALSHDGSTPWHRAAERGHKVVVMALLDHGASADSVNESGETVLHLAAQGGCVDIVIEMLNRGASVHALTASGTPVLHFGVWSVNLDVVEELLMRGPDVNVAPTFDRRTALHDAVTEGSVEIVMRLLENGARVDAEDDKGNTLIYVAAISAHGADLACALGARHRRERVNTGGKGSCANRCCWIRPWRRCRGTVTAWSHECECSRVKREHIRLLREHPIMLSRLVRAT